MLRNTRSLPSLRTLNNTIKKEIQQQSQNFSNVSTKYNLVVPEIPHYQTIVQRQFVRSVHQTSKTDSSTLLQSKKSEFGLMSLNSLKAECRKRGLKISGRKAELVSRIQTFESSHSVQNDHGHTQNMSTKRPNTVSKVNVENLSSKLKKNFTKSTKTDFQKTDKIGAKGDDSHIDFIKPVDLELPKKVEDDYIVQIPSLSTEASKTPVTKLEKKLVEELIKPSQTIVSKAAGSDSTIFEQGSLEAIEEQNKGALKVTPEEVFEEGEPKDEKYEYDNAQISSKDKTIWASTLATVGLWWALKPKRK